MFSQLHHRNNSETLLFKTRPFIWIHDICLQLPNKVDYMSAPHTFNDSFIISLTVRFVSVYSYLPCM